ncbi:WUSCHEL-related homeobox 12-like [Apium graveolens]|uniref:WUSCHEL-related homeobox 12-like n=1 Tax=Apium graveolens TaxID=4045 RepID=UPI003D7982DD
MQDGNHQQQASLSSNRPNNRSSASGSGSKTSNETARVRWKPTAQQITILEHIFNSGTVNPPKDVTTNIRRQLEQFGAVEDVNIFYWFQNRRSRWSRRLRQMRSDSASAVDPITSNATNRINFSPPVFNFEPSPQSSLIPDYNANIHMHISSSSANYNYEQDFGVSSSVSMFPDTTSCMPNHPAGSIRVFINGKATKLPTRPVDMRGMFGQDLMLVHPTGVPVNEFGYDLQHGESYFLVPRPT